MEKCKFCNENEQEETLVDSETLVEVDICAECFDSVSNDNSPKTDILRPKGICFCGSRMLEDGINECCVDCK